jgi:NADPH:quinone reductase-like Zn-dependent oxidoreductase
MRAVVATAYGSPDVLEIRVLDKPTPRSNEILIRIHATTVTAGDWRMRSLDVPTGFRVMARLALGVFRLRQPVLGSELAGTIETVGGDVTGFHRGDRIFAFTGARGGCHAEYIALRADAAIAHKPANLSFGESAALSFGGTTALSFLRRAGIRRGERVLINGASGGVGTAAIQLARHFGAEVTGVCSTGNLALAESLGADHVIDYTKEDFACNGVKYDIIMDTAGTVPFSRARQSLSDGGRLLVVLGGVPAMLMTPWAALATRMRIVSGPASGSAEDLRFLAALAEEGRFRPVIDRRYTFEQIPDAHRYVDLGRKRGNVIITVHDDGTEAG